MTTQLVCYAAICVLVGFIAGCAWAIYRLQESAKFTKQLDWAVNATKERKYEARHETNR